MSAATTAPTTAAVAAASNAPRQIVLTKEAHGRYVEVRQKLEMTVRTLETINASVHQTRYEVRRLDMTSAVVNSVPEEAKLYKNYGRMYLQEPRADILSKADSAKKSYTTQLDELGARHKQLQLRQGELEKELNEIVESGQKQ